jgi:hypothetical protein
MRFAYPGYDAALRLVLKVGVKVGAQVMFPAPPLSRKERGEERHHVTGCEPRPAPSRLAG